MNKILKTLSLTIMLISPLLTGCKNVDQPKKYEVTFTLNHDEFVINEGFAIIGDFCEYGEVGEGLSDEAIILNWVDNGLYRGEKTFNEPTTLNYKLVKFANDMIFNRITEIENIPDRILVVESDDVSIHLEWEKLE